MPGIVEGSCDKQHENAQFVAGAVNAHGSCTFEMLKNDSVNHLHCDAGNTRRDERETKLYEVLRINCGETEADFWQCGKK